MSLSTLPLSYCTNVHPGRSIAEVERGLDAYTCKVAQATGKPLSAGLWLAAPVIRELLASNSAVDNFARGLEARGLTCHTLNAFPYGDFHSERVKERVYVPDWTQAERLDFTHDCAVVLAKLIPDGVEGSISTVPLGFKQFEHPPDFLDRCVDRLIELARRLNQLYDETGKRIRLAIEPEPLCLVETTAEAISFFERLRTRAADAHLLDEINNFIGVCYDVCHQAVEFEDIAESIASLERAGIRINKVHITCALELDRPRENAEGREALAQYVEPRYLHQTMAKTSTGEVLKYVDLSRELALEPPPDFLDAPRWRVHFHAPVDAEVLGPLKTTRTELKQALAAVAALSYAPHLEVETYTWEVLPAGQRVDLVEGLTREMNATHALLAGLRGAKR